MFVRQLSYLITLAREQHFARAAKACNVSQSTLSSGIRRLEEELGVAIVRRGQFFQGFTPEGERFLAKAQAVFSSWEALKEDAQQTQLELKGKLKLGAIPTALSMVPFITEPCQQAYTGLEWTVISLSSEQIVRRLDEYELDIGLTYLEDPTIKGFRILKLYQERHVLLTRDTELFKNKKSISWKEAAQLPLCLLTPNMQNRRLIDSAFRQEGVTPKVTIETDSVLTLYSQVRCANVFSIVPHSFLCLFEMRQEVTAIPLEPALVRDVGLISRHNEQPSTLLQAVWDVSGRLNLQPRLDVIIDEID